MSTRRFFREQVIVPLLISIGVMIVLSIAVYYVFAKNSEYTIELYSYVAEIFDQKGIVDEEGNVSAVKLFANNVQAAGAATLMGIVPFFFLPVFVLVTNSVIMGIVFAAISSMGENPWLYLAGGILPHGIFEIPAICMGITLGIMICRFECSKIRGKGWLCNYKASDFFVHIIKIFTVTVIPLLIIAAVIEANITPQIMNYLL